MKYYNIQARPSGWHKVSSIIIDMTEEMNDILNGAMLGDGHLRRYGINANFYYGSKSYQHVKYVCDPFMKYCAGQGISYRNRYDKRTDKHYEYYEFSTIASPTFTEAHNRWYQNGIKNIPHDIILSPLICKIWYIGDGSLISNPSCNSQRLMLYTNCFQKDDLENIILPQLNIFEPILCRMNKNKDDGTGYAIAIYKKENIIKFLEFIGSCPFDDYYYKWDVKESLVKNFSKYANEWLLLYQHGMTTTQIATIYKCSSTTVATYLKANGIKLKKEQKNEESNS